MTWGRCVQWKVGDRAKWFGMLGPPLGATSNPPSPGWTPPSRDEIAHARVYRQNMLVTILAADDGVPRIALADDGFEFDPSIDLWHLVDGSHPDWEHPDVEGRQKRGYR